VIRRARELGLRVVAVDRNPDASGLREADVPRVVDFSTPGAVLADVRDLGIDGVLTVQAERAVPMVAYHNSWPYFARRFRLEFVGFIEVKPGVPPAPSHLARIIATMKARGVRIVIREPHEPERDVAFVAARAGASVVILGTSVGALLRANDYISMFDANVEALASAAATR